MDLCNEQRKQIDFAKKLFAKIISQENKNVLTNNIFSENFVEKLPINNVNVESYSMQVKLY